MKKPFPRINPLIAIGLERYLSEIKTAAFHDQERNVVPPELITEMLRIIRDVRP